MCMWSQRYESERFVAVVVNVIAVILLLSEVIAQTTARPLDPTQGVGEFGEHFEGDMIFPFNATPSLGRAGVRYTWPDSTVYYQFDDSVDSDDRNLIENGMKDISSRTCIKFVNGFQPNDRDFAFITTDTSNGRGCSSSVGRVRSLQDKYGDPSPNLPQLLNLGSGCLVHGIIVHELIHTIGFLHEQSRPDRDDYVIIYTQNILPGYDNQFEKMHVGEWNGYGTEYDYQSIMHYPSIAFSVDRRSPTITPIKPIDFQLGQRDNMSSIDTLEINRMYNCPQLTTTAQAPKPNKGSPNGDTRGGKCIFIILTTVTLIKEIWILFCCY